MTVFRLLRTLLQINSVGLEPSNTCKLLSKQLKSFETSLPPRRQLSVAPRRSIATRIKSSALCQNRTYHIQHRAMSRASDHTPLKNPPKIPLPPRPSSSVLLISPTNQILLLHRVQTSSSFPSAHVFPGGTLSAKHDGEIPAPDSPLRHEDGEAYRLAAIRETFEESGILLAKSKKTGRLLTELGDEEREEGRKAVHGGKVRFTEWLAEKGGIPDTGALIPFTRWITPPNVPKRFTTQMYLYLLPLPTTNSTTTTTTTATSSISSSSPAPLSAETDEVVIPTPTPDGGLEHTAARFLPAAKWLSLARSNRIILFPPQFFLLSLLSPHLGTTLTSAASPIPSPAALAAERAALQTFLAEPRAVGGNPEPSWADACISPLVLGPGQYGDGKGKMTVLRLDQAGENVGPAGRERRGVREWVVVTKFLKEGPRDVDVKRAEEVFGEGWERGKL